jgi:hypothetical protein
MLPFSHNFVSLFSQGAIQANISKINKTKGRKSSAPPQVPEDEEQSSILRSAIVPVEKSVDELAEEEWALPVKNQKKGVKAGVKKSGMKSGGFSTHYTTTEGCFS